ncbi:MAG: glycosyltransferase [SAR86 cluster bacterium]|jgi:glycosyltransferase involved in cell wall biosynthesis|nr:MAG: glycosyltransferase [SAR86 cluster bacterium]|tara:strand:- start:11 stop:1111 length:1101 start_codon:yes stop_codon:yes gene_type:complete
MRKLKIVQILPTLNTGGVERGVLDFNKYLIDRGHESYVISNGGRQVKNLINDGGSHIHIQVSKKSFLTLLQAKKLADVINEISPDIVHVRSRIPAWVTQLSKLFIKNPRPIFFSTFHGLYSTPFYSRIMASFDYVIAISKTVNEYILENYKNHLKTEPRLIYRGSDQDYFTKQFQVTEQYRENFFSQFPKLVNKEIIAFPGRLSSWKGQESFIKLISSLPDNYSGLIVGPYEDAKKKYYKKLLNLIRDYNLENRVFFYNAKDDIREIYSLSALVMNLSSAPEPFGRTLLEAAMMGKKICGWNRGGVGEVLKLFYEEGQVEFKDFKQLTEKTKSIIARNNKPKEVFLTSELMHQKTIDFYLEALGKS